jgi:protocatechuate 3,4-dioxygenase beta subunit
VHLGGELDGADALQVNVTLVSGLAVSGVVRDPDGREVAGARVWLEDPAGGVVARTTCDAGGRYCFADVRSGSYRLVAAGYRTASTDLTVRAGQDVATQLTLADADHADAPA